MFAVTMLPAAEGDCLWVEYGSAESPHRILVDGGTPPTYRGHLRERLEQLGAAPFIDLFIVTHIDTDHVGGVLRMLNDPPPGLKFGEVWFNAWRHIAPSLDLMGPIDGEILSTQLDAAGWNWNTAFQWRGRSVRVPQDGEPLPSYSLPLGMKLTVVSPGVEQLVALMDNWKEVAEEGGLAPGVPSQELVDKARQKGVQLDLLGGDPVPDWANSATDDLDASPANGSSIAVLAEYEDEGVNKRCLLSGDAHGSVLASGVRRLAAQLGEQQLRVDAFKLPHHGSLRNVTRELIETVDCHNYLVSSNGKRHDHPHREAIARILMYGSKRVTLHFNYRTEFNDLWEDRNRQASYEYEVNYGDGTLTMTV